MALISNTYSRNTEVKKQAKKYLNFARLAYCLKRQVKNDSCEICSLIKEKGYQVVNMKSVSKKGINYTMVVSLSESEVVISFGGPKSENVSYLQQIYAGEIITIPSLNNLHIEKEFWKVYSTYFRKHLSDVLSSLKEYSLKVIFVGHSFGGALTQISAYDMVHNKVISQTRNKPSIYTYGALKVGSHNFGNILSRSIGQPIVRIRRSLDFFTLMPRCIYLNRSGTWHCYRSYVSLVRAFPMFSYYYSKYSPVVREMLVKNVPEIVHVAKSYVNHQIEQNNVGVNERRELSQILHKKGEGVKDHKFINEVSSVFHHKVDDEDKKRFADPTPLKYSPKVHIERLDSHEKSSNWSGNPTSYAHSNYLDQHRHNEVSRERLANHEPLKYSEHSSHNSGVSNERFASHEPLKYQHISHSAGVSNERLASHEPLLYSPNQTLQKDEKNQSNRNTHHHYSFLETKSKLKKQNNVDIYKSCETHGQYVSCKFSPNIHKIFFGIDIESC